MYTNREILEGSISNRSIDTIASYIGDALAYKKYSLIVISTDIWKILEYRFKISNEIAVVNLDGRFKKKEFIREIIKEYFDKKDLDEILVNSFVNEILKFSIILKFKLTFGFLNALE